MNCLHILVIAIIALLLYIVLSPPRKSVENFNEYIDNQDASPEVKEAAKLIAPVVAQAITPSVSESVAPAVAQAIAPEVAQAIAPAVAQAVAPAVAQAVAPAVAQAIAPAVSQAVSQTSNQIPLVPPSTEIPPVVPDFGYFEYDDDGIEGDFGFF
jgi:hypothetical protein